MGKGSSFEREVCKSLSLWWTGQQRDDIFWRSSQSGGRATQRAKSGKKTFGSYGDIAAVDPIGQPLLQMFTIELKRGRSHGCPSDLFESTPTKAIRPFEAALWQAMEAHWAAGSRQWMLICRRDRRRAIVYIPALKSFEHALKRPPTVHYLLAINRTGGESRVRVEFFGLPLDCFCKRVSPSQVEEELARSLQQ